MSIAFSSSCVYDICMSLYVFIVCVWFHCALVVLLGVWRVCFFLVHMLFFVRVCHVLFYLSCLFVCLKCVFVALAIFFCGFAFSGVCAFCFVLSVCLFLYLVQLFCLCVCPVHVLIYCASLFVCLLFFGVCFL